MLRAKKEGVASLVGLLHAIAGFGLLMWVCMFLLSRVHKLHEAYGMLEAERNNDEWLVEQCRKDDFYHNMKHHSSLCDSVQRKQYDILLLRAVERVIEETYLCGYDSCGQLLVAFGDYMLGRGIVLTACLALAALLLPTLLLPVFRRKLNGMADQRMQELYNRPFGDTHYLQTHPYQAVEYMN